MGPLALLALSLPPALEDATLEHVYEADLAAARAAGIAAAGESEAEQLEDVRRDLELRVRLAAPEGVDVGAELAPGGRVVVRLEGPLEEGDAARLVAEAAALDLLRFLAVAEDEDLEALGTSLAEEELRLERWRAEHPGSPLARFRDVPRAGGGPHARLVWTEHAEEGRGPSPLLVPEDPLEDFRASDVERASRSVDLRGYPAVGFALRGERAAAFGAFTARIVRRPLAVVVRGVVRSAPIVAERLPGTGIVEGGFDEQEALDLVAALRAPAVAAPVRLVETR